MRADAQVQWIIPRPLGERIPTRARVLEVAVARPGAAALVTRTVIDRRRVRRIAGLIDRLQTVQPEAINCPSFPTNAAVVAFTFLLGGASVVHAAQEMLRIKLQR